MDVRTYGQGKPACHEGTLFFFCEREPKPADLRLSPSLRDLPGSTTMLAEIFMLRLEAIRRVSTPGTSITSDIRFVPIKLPAIWRQQADK
jgi:hypothetical protein